MVRLINQLRWVGHLNLMVMSHITTHITSTMTMKVDESDKVIARVIIPVVAAQPVRLLADKCERAELLNNGEIIAEATPGQFIQNEYISKYELGFYGGAAFIPSPGTSAIVYYDEDDYPPGKFPSITMACT